MKRPTLKIINNFTEPIKKTKPVKPKETFWEKFDRIIHIVLF